MKNDTIRDAVRDHYAAIAVGGGGCCDTAGSESACCDDSSGKAIMSIGYAGEDANVAPDAAVMSLGCGNPTAIASLNPGETVLDLGSGGGFDCFLASTKVGPDGRIIGVDMTPEMISKARANAEKGGYTNTEFRLGEVEHLPTGDNSVDVIMSNCVINLVPDKSAVYQEAFRVLAPGGRVAVSDVVRTAPFPEDLLDRLELHSACTVGASGVEETHSIMTEAGFVDIDIDINEESRAGIDAWVPDMNLGRYAASAMITARKPE
jgi:arsenite methyltransferase